MLFTVTKKDAKYLIQETAFIENYFANDETAFVYSESERKSYLNKLLLHNEFESFHIVFDIKEFQIKNISGIEKILEYAAANFSAKKFKQIIHPNFAAIACFHYEGYLDLLQNNKFDLQLGKPLYSFLVALKHSNGLYLIFKATAITLQKTTINKLAEIVYKFDFLKEWNNEIFSSRLVDQKVDLTIQFNHYLKLLFAKSKILSSGELKIATAYIENMIATNSELAVLLNLKKHTINTINKRIIEKIDNSFLIKFNTAKEASIFLKKVNLI